MLWGVKWYFWVILLVTAILAIFMWKKALSTSKERRARLKAEGEIWKRDYDLRQNFSFLTAQKLERTPSDELLHGVAMNIQVALEKESNMNAAFELLPIEKKYIYTLEYFNEDAKKNLSVFFKNNGSPLIGLAGDSLEAINLGFLKKYTDRLFPMYFEDNEVSIDYSVVDLTDSEFKEAFNSDTLCRNAADYIITNKEIFLK